MSDTKKDLEIFQVYGDKNSNTFQWKASQIQNSQHSNKFNPQM